MCLSSQWCVCLLPLARCAGVLVSRAVTGWWRALTADWYTYSPSQLSRPDHCKKKKRTFLPHPPNSILSSQIFINLSRYYYNLFPLYFLHFPPSLILQRIFKAIVFTVYISKSHFTLYYSIKQIQWIQRLLIITRRHSSMQLDPFSTCTGHHGC